MKFSRIAAMPFALAADVVTLGQGFTRSFTQQLFDAERREQSMEYERAIVEAVVRAAQGNKKGDAP